MILWALKHLRQKSLQSFGFGRVKYFVRRTGLDDSAAVKERDSVRMPSGRNPISWVTTTIVMPPAPRSAMRARMSLTISGSSAEVASSKNITCGAIARARAIATRCCWPPDRVAGLVPALCLSPTRSN